VEFENFEGDMSFIHPYDIVGREEKEEAKTVVGWTPR